MPIQIIFVLGGAVLLSMSIAEDFYWAFPLPFIVILILFVLLLKPLLENIKLRKQCDLFVVSEMKGYTKKLKTKGLNINLSKEDKNIYSHMTDDKSYERLSKIKQIYKEGLISEEEYSQKKKEILDKL